MTLFAANEALSLTLAVKSNEMCIPGLEPHTFEKEGKANPTTQTGSLQAAKMEYEGLSAPLSKDFGSLNDFTKSTIFCSAEGIDCTFQRYGSHFDFDDVWTLPPEGLDVTFEWQVRDFDFDSVWNLPVPSEKELVRQGFLERDNDFNAVQCQGSEADV